MSKIKNIFLFNNFVSLIFCFLPISFILGPTIIHLNIFLILLFGLRIILINKLKLNLTKIEFFLISFFLFYIFSTGLNIQLLGYEYFFKSIFSLRYLALYLLIKVLVENDKLELNLFFKSCLICTSFLCLDLFVQFFYGKNLFNMYPIEGYISGFFGSEPVAGGYIQKLFLFSFLGVFSFFEKKRYKNLFIFLFLFIHANAAMIASNRMSLILLMFTLVILFIFFSSLRKIMTLSLIPIFISFFFLTSTFESLSIPLKKLQGDIEKTQAYTEEKNFSTNTQGFFGSTHGRVFASVIHSYKDNIFFGNGYKSFRVNCNKLTVLEALEAGTLIYKQFCSTHPHNYQLEVLHDTGIIGFSILSIFVFLKLLKGITRIIKRNNLNYVYCFLFLNFFIEIFPLKSTGSLFTTWNGTLAWLIISLFVCELKKNKYQDAKRN